MVDERKRPEPDGHVTPQVGSWSADKHWYVQRYVDIFTTGMKNRGWELHYVDLFAGAGVEDVEGRGLQWGSPLIAAQATNRFARLHLVELDPEKYAALCDRIEPFRQPVSPVILNGDANSLAFQVISQIPLRGTLSLAFLDPYGLHLSFDTLRALTANDRRIDLIIFFPDHVDALRNFGIYVDNPDSNLDRVLGCPDWRSILGKSPRPHWAQRLRELYVFRIRSLGYQDFDYRRIARAGGHPLYQLLFCSRHERGGEFWRKIAMKSPDGQGSLF